MQGAPTAQFWGKSRADESGQPTSWHPLEHHSADVAACTEALLACDVLRRRLAALAGRDDLDPTAVARLSVLALFHDLGKFNHGFQAKAWRHATRVAGHVDELAAVLATRELGGPICDAIGFAELSSWGADGAIDNLLWAAISHHGRPARRITPDGSLWRARGGLVPIDGMRQLGARAREWFPTAFGPGGAPLSSNPSFQHAYAGVVMLADWLGSDTNAFEYSDSLEQPRMEIARPAARALLVAIGLDAGPARRTLTRAPDFGTLWPGRQPRPAQRAIAALPRPGPGSLSILESETGSGKTEAALLRYLTLFHAGEADGLYFALPTRSAATQIHRRVTEAVRQAFPDPAIRPPVVLAVPGYLRVDDTTGARLPGFEVLWNDSDLERWRFRGWAAENAKRYLAGAVVVGTVDQVLLGALSVSHSHLRATSLLRQFLVVDEVHASDPYMETILAEVLDRHRQAGGHALLMSATLAAELRARLFRFERRKLPTPDLDAAISEPYPLVSHREGQHPATRHHVQASADEKPVSWHVRPDAGELDRIAAMTIDAAERGARVLVIRNTVKDCVATHEAIERAVPRDAPLLRCAGVQAPHHSRFACVDREKLDAAVEEALGASSRTSGVVVVGTQTLQQSLDLDADLLITDLCPMDVLLQRIGRLHRHGDRPRPKGFGRASAVVLSPDRPLVSYVTESGAARAPHGLGTVYEDLAVLELTRRAIEGRPDVSIPANNRLLVELALHPGQRAVLAGEAEPWRTHANLRMGAVMQKSRQGALVLSDWSVEFMEAAFASSELGQKIRTRLATMIGWPSSTRPRWAPSARGSPIWRSGAFWPATSPSRPCLATSSRPRAASASRGARAGSCTTASGCAPHRRRQTQPRKDRAMAMVERSKVKSDSHAAGRSSPATGAPTMAWNSLDDPLLRTIDQDGRSISCTLPQVMAGLAAGSIQEFSALRTHQEQAWFAFLVQLGALALARGEAERLPDAALTWRELLLGLSEGRVEPWCLFVADLGQPALLQPPVPEGSVADWKRVDYPDEIDVLNTAKNHDVKGARIRTPHADHWLYALLALQTHQGFFGAGNYGIARMNGGFGSRPSVGFAPDESWSARFRRDVDVGVRARARLLESEYPYRADGIALLWIPPWNGATSLGAEALDPLFLEICRRARLVPSEGGQVTARLTTSRCARVEGLARGDTGDMWTPIERTEAKALSISGSGFGYELTQALLVGEPYAPGYAQELGSTDSVWVARALARGQGETAGLHHRTVPIPPQAHRRLVSPSGRSELQALARERVELAALMMNKVLAPALHRLRTGGGEGAAKVTRDPARRALETRIDKEFFPALWRDLELGELERPLAWGRFLKASAEEVLARAIASTPLPSARRHRAIAAAEAALRRGLRKHFSFLDPVEDTHETQP